MSKRVRIRCPACGMLVTQKRLNKDYNFEFVIQEITSEGQGGIKNKYKKSRVADSDGAEVFQYMVAMKLMDKAQKLFDEIGEDIEIEIHVPDEEKEEIKEGYKESVIEYETETETEIETEYQSDFVFETEVGGVEFEAEIESELESDDLKRKSLWSRIFHREDKEVEEAMSEVGEMVIESEVEKIEFVVEEEV